MEAQCAIDFELLFAEQLVEGDFVRKRVVASRVVKNIVVLIVRQRRFDVDEISGLPTAISRLYRWRHAVPVMASVVSAEWRPSHPAAPRPHGAFQLTSSPESP